MLCYSSGKEKKEKIKIKTENQLDTTTDILERFLLALWLHPLRTIACSVCIYFLNFFSTYVVYGLWENQLPQDKNIYIQRVFTCVNGNI